MILTPIPPKAREKMNNCITCKKNNKGDNWRNCRLKCHYKYEQQKKDEIYKLQEEKEQLQKRFNDYKDRKIEENASLLKKLDIADKKLTVFSRELEQANKENERLKEDYIKLCQQKDLDNARWQKRCTDLHIEDKSKADKYWLTLQKVKAIAKGIRSYLEIPAPRDVRFEMDRILNLITEIELFDQKESEV